MQSHCGKCELESTERLEAEDVPRQIEELGRRFLGMSNATTVPRASACFGRPPAKHINAMTRTPAHPPPINAVNTHQIETIGSPHTNFSSQYRPAYSAACHVESGLYLVMPFAICTV